MVQPEKKPGRIRMLFGILGSRIILALVIFLTDIALARVMTVSDRGMLLALQSSILLFGSWPTLGLEYGFMFAEHLPGLRSIIQSYKKIIPILFITGITLSILLGYRYKLDLVGSVSVSLIMISEILTILALPLLLQYKNVTSYGLARIWRRGMVLCLMLGAYLFLDRQKVPVNIALMIVASGWISALLYALTCIRSATKRDMNCVQQVPGLLKTWIKGASMFIAKNCERFQTQVGLLILGLLGFPREAAFFAIGSQAIDLAIFASGSLSIGLLTKSGNKNLVTKDDVIKLVGIINTGALLGIVCIWVFLERILVMLYGQAYGVAAELIKILSPALVIYSGCPLVSTFLLRQGRRRLTILGSTVALATNILSCIILVKTRALDAATGCTVSLLFGLTLNMLIVGVGLLIEKSKKISLKHKVDNL